MIVVLRRMGGLFPSYRHAAADSSVFETPSCLGQRAGSVVIAPWLVWTLDTPWPPWIWGTEAIGATMHSWQRNMF